MLLRKSYLLAGWLCLLMAASAHGQGVQDTTAVQPAGQKHFYLKGYIKDLQSVQFMQVQDTWLLDNLIHNREEVKWYLHSRWSIEAALRNRLLYGASAPLYQQQSGLLGDEGNLLNLSATLAKGKSYLLHSSLDRLSLNYVYDRWQVAIGRQRINWGLNLVWNPNDLYNAYSYFDFDYEERPGSDAVRVQYYTGSTSWLEFAVKPGRKADDVVISGLYRRTIGSYDVQWLAGIAGKDFALGTGWSGSLGQAGFNGEVSCFIPQAQAPDPHTVVSASTGINYTFPNSLYLHGAYLYNSRGVVHADSLSADFFLYKVSAKSLSPSRHSVFGEVAYNLSPLIRGDLACIVNPSDGSLFFGPFFTFSLSNTTEFLAGGQFFLGGDHTLYGGYGEAIFLRLKWSF